MAKKQPYICGNCMGAAASGEPERSHLLCGTGHVRDEKMVTRRRKVEGVVDEWEEYEELQPALVCHCAATGHRPDDTVRRAQMSFLSTWSLERIREEDPGLEATA